MTTAKPTWTDALPPAAEWPADMRERATTALSADLDAATWERVRLTWTVSILGMAREAAVSDRSAAQLLPMVDGTIAWLEAGAPADAKAALVKSIAPTVGPAARACKAATARDESQWMEIMTEAMDAVERSRGDVGAAQLRLMTSLLDAVEVTRG